MHHKRKRPKNRRAGCLMCKPHKMNGAKKKQKHTVLKQMEPLNVFRDELLSKIY